MTNKQVVHDRKAPSPVSTEVKNPDAAAQVILSMAEFDGANLEKAIKEAGLPTQTAKVLRARVRELYAPVLETLKDLSKDAFVNALQVRRKAALEAITGAKLEASSASQLAVVYGILQDKQALLEGDPTSIVRFEDMRIISELAPLLVKEFERRGIPFMDAKPEDEAEIGDASYVEVGA